MTTINSLYEQAIVNKALFQKQTGMKLEEFEKLAPYFKISCARALSDKEQLFAILYSQTKK